MLLPHGVEEVCGGPTCQASLRQRRGLAHGEAEHQHEQRHVQAAAADACAEGHATDEQEEESHSNVHSWNSLEDKLMAALLCGAIADPQRVSLALVIQHAEVLADAVPLRTDELGPATLEGPREVQHALRAPLILCVAGSLGGLHVVQPATAVGLAFAIGQDEQGPGEVLQGQARGHMQSPLHQTPDVEGDCEVGPRVMGVGAAIPKARAPSRHVLARAPT
mmetsp:Transcript_39580/g.126891  ORF Transcript_39580/g.126891 Transcript_39580/m.126891 type:complete len:221 (+) Transcript_39580:1417-2079(+)